MHLVPQMDTKGLVISTKAPDVAEPVAIWMELEMVGIFY